MQKTLLLLLICTFFACKKQKDLEVNLTNKDWVLTTATISPARIVNGIPQTDYMVLSGSGGCLQNNYTISFSENGTWTLGSNGPLCDMLVNTDTQKWAKDGNKVTLKSNADEIVATVDPVKLQYSQSFSTDGIDYTIDYMFIPKAK